MTEDEFRNCATFQQQQDTAGGPSSEPEPENQMAVQVESESENGGSATAGGSEGEEAPGMVKSEA